ncbi:transglycosylase domain-containing protein [Desulfosarcina cetonica]|uniref:transglycosylase domain-containing protein n=1 Tax=Desulfosarcina cetonica TaxID=90730 RepID=UPI0006D229DB|nr:PBP1A family penicillin-binding protein [Desulfosarcina cetonica]
MKREIFIYGPNAVRGRIIHKTLATHGIQARYCSGTWEMEKALEGIPAPIVILDLISTLPADLTFRGRLAGRTMDALLITLVDAPDAAMVRESAGVEEVCVLAPVDPRYILTLVLEALRGELHAAAMAPPAIRRTDEPLPIPVIPPSRKKIKQPSLLKRLFSGPLMRFAAIMLTLTVGLTGGYVLWCFSSLPDVDILADYRPYRGSVMYSDDNRRLTEFFIERRTLIPYRLLPEAVTQAVLAIEDTRYFKHSGVDPIRIAGALAADLKAGTMNQGASTITQQLVKMIFLTPEKTISRKVREVLLALKIEQLYDKHEILEMYLNKAYFGARAYGIDMASHTYFDKPATQLNISEAALLAGMLKAPSAYSPFTNATAARVRRGQVLSRMREVGFIDEMQYQAALQTPLPVRGSHSSREYNAPYFVAHCRQILEDRIGERLYTSGLSIYTTLDHRFQERAEKAVAAGIKDLNRRYPGKASIQAAVISMEVDSGRIRAMVGGTDFWSSQFNRATLAKRQPGSAFKPFVYLTALEQGYNPQSLIEDVRRVYGVDGTHQRWSPRNYHDRYHGLVTLEKALSRSMNAATVNLAKQVGIDTIIATAHRLGVQSDIHRVYPSVLGASEITLLELVRAYAAMASGYRVEPVCIDRIIDKDRSIMIEPTLQREQVINPEVLASLKAMLRSVITEGTGRRARALDRVVYGKTGTTNSSSDASSSDLTSALSPASGWAGTTTPPSAVPPPVATAPCPSG